MNTKSSWIALALVLLAILFVPIVPSDAAIDCDESNLEGKTCDSVSGYTSVYNKYFSK